MNKVSFFHLLFYEKEDNFAEREGDNEDYRSNKQSLSDGFDSIFLPYKGDLKVYEDKQDNSPGYDDGYGCRRRHK